MLRGEPIWHTSSTGPMSMPSSSDAVATSASRSPGAQPGLDPVAPLLREAAVVRGDDVVAEPLAELVGEAFGEAARVRRTRAWCGAACTSSAMRSSTSAICSAERDRLELAVGQLEREVEVALVAGVDDRRAAAGRRRAAGRRSRSAAAWRTARSRLGRPVAQRLEPLEREREVRAALVARDGVDLVDDHRLDRAQERRGPSRW